MSFWAPIDTDAPGIVFEGRKYAALNVSSEKLTTLTGQSVSVESRNLLDRLIPDQALWHVAYTQVIPEFESFKRTMNLLPLRSNPVNIKAACQISAIMGQAIHLNKMEISFNGTVPRQRYVFTNSMEALFQTLPLSSRTREAAVQMLQFAQTARTSTGTSLLEHLVVLQDHQHAGEYYFEMDPWRDFAITWFDQRCKVGQKLLEVPAEKRLYILTKLFQSRRQGAQLADCTEIRAITSLDKQYISQAGVCFFPRAESFDSGLDFLSRFVHESQLVFSQTLSSQSQYSTMGASLAAAAREMEEENSLKVCLDKATQEYPVSAYTLSVRESRLPTRAFGFDDEITRELEAEKARRRSAAQQTPPCRQKEQCVVSSPSPGCVSDMRPKQDAQRKGKTTRAVDSEVPFHCVQLLSRGDTHAFNPCLPEEKTQTSWLEHQATHIKTRSQDESGLSKEYAPQKADRAVTKELDSGIYQVVRIEKNKPPPVSEYDVRELGIQKKVSVPQRNAVELLEKDFKFPSKEKKKDDEKANRLIKKLLETTAKQALTNRSKIADVASSIADKTKLVARRDSVQQSASDITRSDIMVTQLTTTTQQTLLDEQNVSAIFMESFPKKKQGTHLAASILNDDLDDAISQRSDINSVSQVSSYFTAKALSQI